MVVADLVRKILESYPLSWDGIHGVAHWARVLENGVRLAEDTGARLEVIQLFALLHDSQRINESIDPGHGRRAADFARTLRGEFFDIADEDFEALYEACADHTVGRMTGDVTICVCWDSDRLDLARAGIHPRPSRLCTSAAKNPNLISWATQRSVSNFVPDIVFKDWGLFSE